MDIALQILSLFGGLGMFLFGMNTMSTGLERAAGDKLRQIMEKVTGNYLMSVILGAVVAGAYSIIISNNRYWLLVLLMLVYLP